MPVPFTIDSYMGYLQSWSSYNTYRKKHPERVDPLIEIRSKLLAAYDTSDETHAITVNFPVFILSMKKHK